MVKYLKYSNNPQLWLEKVAGSRTEKEMALIRKAIQVEQLADVSLLDKGLVIADILFQLSLDSETLAAALIYPAIQTGNLSFEQVRDNLASASLQLLQDVLQIQSLGKLQYIELRHPKQIENLRKMLLAMVSDVRAVLIILAERVYQLREAKKMPLSQQTQLAQESLEVFAPLANRLGVWELKWEIEDLSFRYLQPETYKKIATRLASKRIEREAYIKQMIKLVSNQLSHAHFSNFAISGRVKHIYSIYRKMRRKDSHFEEIYDISALRILVPEISDCYHALSVLQETWPQFLKEFDDYIAQPKANGYRSLHAVLLGPSNHYVEVQIRTYQMHQAAELGMAAHWQYKEGILQPSSYEAKIALLRQVMLWQNDLLGENKLAKQPLQNLFTDHVYVFTPMGDIIDLPKGATPLDFAYYIHSEVGHRCRGAKINGSIVPLTYQLNTGDRVEILTAKQAKPSRDWLNLQQGYLHTSRARAKLQHWFRIKESLTNVQAGRELLEKELKKTSSVEKFDLQATAEKFHFKTVDELLAALSTGEIRVAQIIYHLRSASFSHLPNFSKPPPKPLSPRVDILGINNLLTQIAHCCKPLPGDKVIGYVTRMRGAAIHRQNCRNMLENIKRHPERLLEVNWSKQVNRNYPIDILIRTADRPGLLRDITNVFSVEKINLTGLQTQKRELNGEVKICVTIEISSQEIFKKLMGLLSQIPSILEIKRK